MGVRRCGLLKARLAMGGVLLVVGFLIYQTGVSVVREGNMWVAKYAAKALSYLSIRPELFNALAVYVGGILAIMGFLLSVSAVTAVSVSGAVSRPGLRGEEFQEAASEGLKCRFCGEVVDEQDVFCPRCSRALR
ncbi:MAG: hypothetical protein QXE22_00375 [Candidatus Bathyarchaeia archaeon]